MSSLSAMLRIRYSTSFLISKPTFLFRFHSRTPSIDHVDDAVSQFNGMPHLRSTPPILGMKHYPTVISLSRSVEIKGVCSNPVIFSIYINVLWHLGQISFAYSGLSAMVLKRGYYTEDVLTLRLLIITLCLKGKVKNAVHFHDELLAQGFLLNPYGTLIDSMCKVGETRAAIQLLRKIEGKLTKLDVVMYNAIIDRCCKDKLVTEAYDLYSEMLFKGIFPTVVTYNTLIHGFCIVGRLEEAIGLFNEMTLKKISLDVYTYSTLMNALCKEGKVKEAKNVLAFTRKEGMKPDVVIYNILMDGYFLVNQVKNAEHLFKVMAQMEITPSAQVTVS